MFTAHLIMVQVFYMALTCGPRDPFTFVDP